MSVIFFATTVWVLVIVNPGFDSSLHFSDKSSCEHFSRALYKRDSGNSNSFCISADNLISARNDGIGEPPAKQ